MTNSSYITLLSDIGDYISTRRMKLSEKCLRFVTFMVFYIARVRYLNL